MGMEGRAARRTTLLWERVVAAAMTTPHGETKRQVGCIETVNNY